eukprot:288520-Chlamydomonas_euryale.AAC.2
MRRVQEDPWNAIGAGALTGGFLQLRSGFRSAAKSAAFGGVLLVRGLASGAGGVVLHGKAVAGRVLCCMATLWRAGLQLAGFRLVEMRLAG